MIDFLTVKEEIAKGPGYINLKLPLFAEMLGRVLGLPLCELPDERFGKDLIFDHAISEQTVFKRPSK